jgi:Cu-processing system ATP-binding protein
LRNVSKSYAGELVLDDVSLTVAAGESLVLVGHNGAGKTTLMKLLLGLISPCKGEVRVFAADPAGSASVVRRGALGYLPESIAFDEAMTGKELLKFYAGLKGADLDSCDALLKRVGIAGASHRRLSTWSKGMRQRLGLAQALLGKPELLLLDEPTSGLDPSLRSTLYEIIESLRADGVTVLLASHALNEVEQHADRVAIMQQGRILACGTLAELSEQAALPVKMRLSCAPESTGAVINALRAMSAVSGSDLYADSGAVADAIQRADVGVTTDQLDSQRIDIVCAQPHKMMVLRQIAELGDAIIDIDIQSPRLDEIYAHCMAAAAAEGRQP